MSKFSIKRIGAVLMEQILKFLLAVAPAATARYAYKTGLKAKIEGLVGSGVDVPLVLEQFKVLGSVEEPAEGSAEADLKVIVTAIAVKYGFTWALVKPAIGELGRIALPDFLPPAPPPPDALASLIL